MTRPEPRVLQHGDPCPEVGTRWLSNLDGMHAVVVRAGLGWWINATTDSAEAYPEVGDYPGWAWWTITEREYPMVEVLP